MTSIWITEVVWCRPIIIITIITILILITILITIIIIIITVILITITWYSFGSQRLSALHRASSLPSLQSRWPSHTRDLHDDHDDYDDKIDDDYDIDDYYGDGDNHLLIIY